MSSLDDIARNPESKQKGDLYLRFLEDAIARVDITACEAFVDHVLTESVPLVLSRQLLGTFASSLHRLEPDVQVKVSEHALERIQPRAVSYEEQAAALRERLASVCESREEWSRAARALAGIDLDSGMRTLDPEYKLQKNVKIAMLYLEDDDALNAELYIKKASALLGAVKNPELELQYKSCYARILDSKRRFVEAATRYYDLSHAGSHAIGDGRSVHPEDLEQALRAATTCAILASAGAQRSRILATLYKDERTMSLPVFPFLEKVYLERLLTAEEVARFAEDLVPHQMATLPDGSTVLERAVIEHNLEATSKLYRNIYIDELASLLGIPEDTAEQAAARMIGEKRLHAIIDRSERLLIFLNAPSKLSQWDANINGICRRADAVLEVAHARLC